MIHQNIETKRKIVKQKTNTDLTHGRINNVYVQQDEAREGANNDLGGEIAMDDKELKEQEVDGSDRRVETSFSNEQKEEVLLYFVNLLSSQPMHIHTYTWILHAICIYICKYTYMINAYIHVHT